MNGLKTNTLSETMNQAATDNLGSLLVQQFESNEALLTTNDTDKLKALRSTHFQQFVETGFPDTDMEKWRFTDMEAILEQPLLHELTPKKFEANVEELFRCEVHNFQSEIISVLNGWYYSETPGLITNKDGVIYGSLLEAKKTMPQLFDQYFGEAAHALNNSFVNLNTAMAQDGVFIYVPKGVEASRTLQIIKMVDHHQPVFVQTRQLIILEAGSSLSLMHCDDSINQHPSLMNTVTEIFVAQNARLELYKLQNLNDNSALVNSTFIRQQAGSTVKTNTLTFNGGLIRNNVEVALDGQGAHADVLGLYLMDKEQHVDNQIRVLHNAPHCTSNELFKGILDDEASAVFNGYIFVKKDAQKTNAYQNNKNILLKPTARVNSMPFLEIYADDVKCSHGATIGQLDQEAMFYLRSRGIGQSNARLLLMYAFAADVINLISIDGLRNRIDDMVKKRLRGELSVCEKCVLHCGSPEKEYHFDIDMSKI